MNPLPSRTLPRTLLVTAIALTLGACFAPPQNFPVGSVLWNRANPDFEGAADAQAINAQHKVLVGVLDGGMDYNSKRLRQHIHVLPAQPGFIKPYSLGWDTLGKDPFPFYAIFDPKEGDNAKDISEDLQAKEHGTHVAQLVTLNDKRIGVVAIRILPIEADEEQRPMPDGTGDSAILDLLLERAKLQSKIKLTNRALDAIADGMAFAHANGMRIINMSIGLNIEEIPEKDRGPVLEVLEKRVLARARTEWQDMMMIAAAGNEEAKLEREGQSIPATLPLPNLIAVGAMKDAKTIASYSNDGRFVDVYMRGSDIKSAVPGDLMQKLSGTSMATPLVAHLAAQVLAIRPELTSAELRGLIMNTADLRLLAVEGSDKAVEGVAQPLKYRNVRVVNMLRARRSAQALPTMAEAERVKLLTAPFLHGAAPN